MHTLHEIDWIPYALFVGPIIAAFVFAMILAATEY